MPPPEPGKLRLLSLKAVQRRLDCSDNTVRRLVELGRLAPPVRHGGEGPPKWWEEDVEAYLLRLYRGEFRESDASLSAEKKTSAGERIEAKPRKGGSKPEIRGEDGSES